MRFCPLQSQVFSTSSGLTKTVYNPAALKSVQRSTEDVLKKKQVRLGAGGAAEGWEDVVPDGSLWFLSQEALKLQQDVRRKKQEILEKHIETQKVRRRLQTAAPGPHVAPSAEAL